ncbi:MAG: hypothetical protein IJW79_00965, partial [Clostridia bacterium]|nr:hypothetical protein [Clostridia bacterium]
MFSIRFVWEKLKGRRWMVIVGLIISIVYSAMVVINPWLSKMLVDDAIRIPLDVSGKPNNSLLIILLIIMSVITLFRTAIMFLRKVLFERSSQKMLSNIRLSIFDNIQHQELSFFDKMKAGDLITRSTSDLNHIRHFVAFTLYTLVDTVVLFVA